MRALVELTSAAVDIDFWECARTPENLGIAGMGKKAMLDYVR